MIYYKGDCPLCGKPFISNRRHTEVCSACKAARSNLKRVNPLLLFDAHLKIISEADALSFLASLVQAPAPVKDDLQAKLDVAQQEAAYWRGRAESAETLINEKLDGLRVEQPPLRRESTPQKAISQDLIGEVKQAAYQGGKEASQNFINSMNNLLGLPAGPKPLAGAGSVPSFDESELDNLGELIQ